MRFDVPSARGWTHLVGPSLQALVRVPRQDPLIRVLSDLADRDDIDGMRDRLNEYDAEASFVAVVHRPVCRVLVAGPARALLSGPGGTVEFGPVDGKPIDVTPSANVTMARLEPADGTDLVEVNTSARGGAAGHDAAPSQGPSSTGAEPSKASTTKPRVSAPPPPDPDAWWLDVGAPESSATHEERTPSRSRAGLEQPSTTPSASTTPGQSESPVDADRAPRGRAKARWSSGGPPTRGGPAAPAAAEPGPGVLGDVDAGRDAQADPPVDTRADTGVAPDTTVSSVDGSAELAIVLLSSGQQWPFDSPCLVGRAPTAPVGESSYRVARLNSPSRTVSRSHLLLTPHPTGARLRDLGSRNGTAIYVPGRPPEHLAPGEERVVELGRGVLAVLSADATVWIAPAPRERHSR